MPWEQIKNYTNTIIFQRVSKNANPWTTKADMPTNRIGAAASVVNNKIYVIGGQNDSFLFKNEEYDAVIVYLSIPLAK